MVYLYFLLFSEARERTNLNICIMNQEIAPCLGLDVTDLVLLGLKVTTQNWPLR